MNGGLRRVQAAWWALATVPAVLLLWLFVPIGVAEKEFRGRVVGVTDGDSITVQHDARQEAVRLHGIDAPERGQAFGERARQFTAALACGRMVVVRVMSQDRYGRTIGDVMLPDGRNLSQEVVRAGYAWWVRRYSTNHRLATLEAQARAAHVGLWADPSPMAPWEWRSGKHGPAEAQVTPAAPAVKVSARRRVRNRVQPME